MRSGVAAAVLLAAVMGAGGAAHAQEPGVPSPAPSASPEAAPSPPPSPPPTITWKDGRTSLQFEKALITLSNRVQIRFTEEMPDDRNRLSAANGGVAPAAGESRGSFRIRRVETQFAGWLYSEDLEYELELALQDTSVSVLNDANVNLHLHGHALQAQMGQFKVPFGRQELVSSSRQEFVDRSIVAELFEHSRDVGFQLSGSLAGDRVEYAGGVFNGGGRGRFTNDNTKYMYDARVMFQPWGAVGYSEVDFESTTHPLVALGAQFEDNDARGATALVDDLWRTYGFDGVLKYKGLFVMAEWFRRLVVPETGPSHHALGFHTQAGYLVYARKVELALRFAQIDPVTGVEHDALREAGGAASYYHRRHTLKVQADLRRLTDQARGIADWQFRLQTQFLF